MLKLYTLFAFFAMVGIQKPKNLLPLLILGMIGIGGAAKAQSPIASPTAISGCTLWLDANKSVYRDTGKTSYAQTEGDNVAYWTDLSGSGHNAYLAGQLVTITGSTGGTFTLSYGSSPTSAIAYNASAATVQAALVAVLGAGTVSVTGSAGGPYTVSGTGSYLGQSFLSLSGNGSSLTGGTSPSVVVSLINAPTLHTTGYAGPASPNSPRSIRFGATTASLLTQVSLTSGSFTIFAVYAPTSTSTTSRLVQGTNNWLMGPYFNITAYNGSSFASGTAYTVGKLITQTVVQTPSTLTTSVNGTSASSVSTGAYPGTITIGFQSAHSDYGQSDLTLLLIYNRALTTSETAQVQDYIARTTGEYSGVSFYGDSRTYGTSSSTGGGGLVGPSYPAQVLLSLNALGVTPPSAQNLGVPGQTTPQLTATSNTYFWPSLQKQVIVVWEMTNDDYFNSPGATGLYNNMVSLCNALKTTCPKATIVVLTDIAANRNSTAQETARTGANALLRADFPQSIPAGGSLAYRSGSGVTYADYLVDIASDSNFAAVTGSYYSGDFLHLSDLGNQQLAADITPLLAVILKSAPSHRRLQ